ncbi:MAG: fructose-bisphosphate aldolase [Mycobacteriaceae bacterium]|nr:fructose-bisphosphate aldolase [Mycobacteriaceae bacterium]
MSAQYRSQLWADRADAAEEAIVTRHLRTLWWLPGTRLAVVAWPPASGQRAFRRWDYWWQAHLLDCAVDAADRAPTPERRTRIMQIARAHRLRNLSGWTNRYYDDMAWLALALERAERTQYLSYPTALGALGSALTKAWDPRVGAVPWRVGDNFYNTPANGPAGLVFARLGEWDLATRTGDWIATTLWDSQSGLIFDGIRLQWAEPNAAGSAPPSAKLERALYTYCQGVTLGLDTELAVRTGEPRFAKRACDLVTAIEDGMTVDGAIDGGGGGDGGLFNGILARYLALAALMLPGDTGDVRAARARAAAIVVASGEAAWTNRLDVNDSPLFGADWRKPAQMPGVESGVAAFAGGTVTASEVPERDLSVQLGGWMLMEAAHRVTAAGL